MSATVKGGFWPANGVDTLLTAHTKSAMNRRVAMLLGTKQMRATRELVVTLLGAAAGSAASAINKRIEANAELGGLRVIESETLVSRVTVAGDIVDLTADLLTSDYHDSTPYANLDGNPLGTR